MPATWVVVADSAGARIFNAPSANGALDEIATFAHPEGRAHDRDLKTDQPGMTKDRVGYARHGMEPKVKPKEQEAINFARFLAKHLEAARSKNEVSRLVLVAAPEFLGHLRNVMDNEAKKIVAGEHSLNVTKLKPDEIRKRLPDRLWDAS
ncbi:MAG TPA: host attachment protein [Casimicrobiaceae bacterium]|nr:host attachment protein [Casimicrobiaceae bacterium]